MFGGEGVKWTKKAFYKGEKRRGYKSEPVCKSVLYRVLFMEQESR